MTEPEIDPGAFAKALAGGAAGISALMSDMDSPMPFHRFSFLIHRALELCAELRGMGEQFLQVKEKKDSEGLFRLKARQDKARQDFMLDLKSLQRHEINKTIESLEQSKEATEMQLTYYLQLIGEPLDKIPNGTTGWEDIEQDIQPRKADDDLRMSPLEAEEMNKAEIATQHNTAAAKMDLSISVLRALPTVNENIQPMGVGISIGAGPQIGCIAGRCQ